MPPANVALVVLDTVRKDTFDERATRIRDRAAVSYERAYAPSSWTVPSHASMFTGDLLHRHGVHAHAPEYDLAPADTFLDRLPDHRTIGVSANSFLSPRFGFDALFDEFEHLHGNEEFLTGGLDTAEFMESTDIEGARRYLAYLRAAASEGALARSLVNAAYMKANNALLGTSLPRVGDYGARTVCRRAAALAEREEPFFLFCNVVDAHAPHEAMWGYDGPVPNSWTSRAHGVWEVNNRWLDDEEGYLKEYEEYFERFRDLYGAAVEYLDRRIAGLIDDLQAATDRPTRVVVTADHGEELGLPGGRGLGHKLPSTPVTHVPLAVIEPPEAASSGVTDGPVSLLDVGDLLVGLAEGDLPDLRRDRCPVERLGVIAPPEERREHWNRGIRAVHDPGKPTDDASVKYEWDTLGARDRYDASVSTERLAASDVDMPEAVTALYDVGLDEYKRRATARGNDVESEVDADTRRRLEDLGYM